MKITPRLATAKRKKYERVKEIIIFLLDHGVDINRPNQQGCTVLHEALIKKHGGRKHLPLVIQTLIELKADLNNPANSRNTTMLHLACGTGITQVVRQIIRATRKVNRGELISTIHKFEISIKEIAQKFGDEKMLLEIDSLLPRERSTISLTDSRTPSYRVLDISGPAGPARPVATLPPTSTSSQKLNIGKRRESSLKDSYRM